MTETAALFELAKGGGVVVLIAGVFLFMRDFKREFLEVAGGLKKSIDDSNTAIAKNTEVLAGVLERQRAHAERLAAIDAQRALDAQRGADATGQAVPVLSHDDVDSGVHNVPPPRRPTPRPFPAVGGYGPQRPGTKGG